MVKQTSKELMLNSFNGKTNYRYPIWFMRQAGRYLPEYMEIRGKMDFEERVQNPEIAKLITLQPIQRFDLDAAIIFSDILVPLYHLDVGLSIVPEIGPKLKSPINGPDDIKRLKKLDAEIDYSYLPESIGLVRDEIPQKALIGFSGAPFTLASYMIEGKSTKNALKTKKFAINHPEAFDDLMTYLTDMITNQLESQIKSGADLIQVFDSWAGFQNAEQFSMWSLPYLQKLFTHFKDIPTIFYARGSSHLLDEAVKTGAKGISIDPSLDIKKASTIVGLDRTIQGNLDPVYLLTKPDLVQDKTNEILVSMNEVGRNKFIFNLGIGIDRESSLDCVYSMVNTVKSFRRE